MTYQEHNELSMEYRRLAIKAIHTFKETMDKKEWENYLLNQKLANKHYGIAQAMFSRKYGKI